MELRTFFLGFAFICIAVGIGLMRRSIWVWYFGWVVLYLFAGFLNTEFFAALVEGENQAALVLLTGGLLLWVTIAVGLAKSRHHFRSWRGNPSPQADPS